MVKKVRTRFAPSPTGYMHVGNLRTALFGYLIAKSNGGDFILRIEDTDRGRYVGDAVGVIYRTLAEAGLRHDEGPDVGGPYGPYVQSERREIYQKYAEQLVREGKAYYCFCTKERLDALKAEQGPDARYDRRCRNLPKEEAERLRKAGKPHVIRQKMPLTGSTTFQDVVYGPITIENKELEDQVLLKSDGYPTYNFANVVDDHLMKITHVVRGCEYLTSTPKYKLLYEAFGWDVPVYIHLPLIMGKNPDGSVSKLSKRHGSTGFSELVEEGYLPEAIVNYIALLGWTPKENREIFTLDELVRNFSVDGIGKSPAVFDYDKLRWMNGEYLRKMPEKEFVRRAMPYFRRVFPEGERPWDILAGVLQPRVTRLAEIPNLLEFYRSLPNYPAEYYQNKKSRTDLKKSGQMLREAIPVLSGLGEWNAGSLRESLENLAEKLGVKNGTLLWPVRIAAAGQKVTPGGAFEILAVLGKDESLRRLELGLKKLEEQGA